MAKRRVKRIKKKVELKRKDLTGYPDVDEFLKTCFTEPVDPDDDLFKNLKTVATTIGIQKTTVLLRHLIMRLFQYDDFYNLLMDDVETNLKQFEIMSKMNVLGDEPEIVQAHKNMMTMSARLDEFARQMEEMSGQPLRKITKPMKAETMDQFSDRVIKEADRKKNG